MTFFSPLFPPLSGAAGLEEARKRPIVQAAEKRALEFLAQPTPAAVLKRAEALALV